MLIHRPAIYEHAAALIGQSAQHALADADLLVRAHLTACERYRLAHVVVGMDIYGCDAAAWSQNLPPPCPPTQPPPRKGEESRREGQGEVESDKPPRRLLSLKQLADARVAPLPAGGQVNILRAAAELRRQLPESVQVRIPITGPFSLAAQVVGFEGLLIGLLDDPAAAEAAMDRLTDALEPYVRATGPTGCGVTFFESAASPPLVRPGTFKTLVLPRLARLLAVARRAGVSCEGDAQSGEATPPMHKSPPREPARPHLAAGLAPRLNRRNPELILGGHTAPILPLLLKLNPALLIADPANDPAEFLTCCRAGGIDLRINLEPRLRLPEHRIEVRGRLEALARLARSAGDQPLFIATGVIPFDADPQTVLDFSELVEQVDQAV